MQKCFSNILTAVLALLVALGSVANAAASIESCMPKACCCKKAIALGATTSTHRQADTNCHGSSPCCQVLPSIPFPEMALTATPKSATPRSSSMAILPVVDACPAQQIYFTRFSYTIINLKIPFPPLYLQNQSFLY